MGGRNSARGSAGRCRCEIGGNCAAAADARVQAEPAIGSVELCAQLQWQPACPSCAGKPAPSCSASCATLTSANTAAAVEVVSATRPSAAQPIASTLFAASTNANSHADAARRRRRRAISDGVAVGMRRTLVNGGAVIQLRRNAAESAKFARGLRERERGANMCAVSRLRLFRFRHAKTASRWAIARVVLLAFVLVGANALTARTMPIVAAATQASHHHDCGMDQKTSSASHDHRHGVACPCCHDGCLCLHFYGSAVPDLLVMRPLQPESNANPADGPHPPAPPIAENLRPPIA